MNTRQLSFRLFGQPGQPRKAGGKLELSSGIPKQSSQAYWNQKYKSKVPVKAPTDKEWSELPPAPRIRFASARDPRANLPVRGDLRSYIVNGDHRTPRITYDNHLTPQFD